MKILSTVPRWTTMRVLVVSTALFIGADPSAWAAPPNKKKQTTLRELNPLERVGDFFFRLSRKLETGFVDEDNDRDPVIIYERRPTPPPREEVIVREDYPTGLTVPPGYRGGNIYYDYPPPRPGISADVRILRPPVQQDYPPPHLRYPDRRQAAPRSGLSIPVDPTSPPDSRAAPEMRTRELSPVQPEAPFDPPSAPPSRTRPETTRPNSSVDPNPPSPAGAEKKGNLEFAAPVPGKPGFVYPPGVAHEPKNMLDVRDFGTAQKVKDPRTGKMFLVPPK